MKTGERAMAMATCVADLTETTPVADAARRVLCMRLETVRDRIGEALTEVKRGGQRVHALRVATRRAAAAVDLFRRCLPHKVGKHLRSRLRLIRRAAGEARDWDVVLGELTGRLERVEVADRPAHDMLSGFVLAHRIPAEQRLRAACRDYPFGFDRLLANSLASIRQRGPDVTTFGGHARPTVLRMVTGFDALCQRGDGGSWEQLHEVRIAAKRLRYALELVQSCIDPGRRASGIDRRSSVGSSSTSRRWTRGVRPSPAGSWRGGRRPPSCRASRVLSRWRSSSRASFRESHRRRMSP
jgi:CHAD domain-containing protein